MERGSGGAEPAAADELERLREENRRLRERHDDVEAFAYAVSHDLREPLRKVVGFCELLAESSAGELGDASRRHLDYVLQGARRMADLIDALLEHARVSTVESAERVELVPVVAEATCVLEPELRAAGATVDRAELPAVLGRRPQLVALFRHLLANAVRHRGEAPPAVRVGATRCGDEVRISVADNGPGIEPKHRERIFEPMTRLQTHAAGGGTGLGLATCRKIVAGHGGRLWCESEPGRGATFFVTLPAAD